MELEQLIEQCKKEYSELRKATVDLQIKVMATIIIINNLT